MTAADIARKVAGAERRLRGARSTTPGPAHDFVQQNNETDWEFLWKLAQRIDFEVLVIDHKLYFRKAGPPAGTQDITLKWGDNLISFKPRDHRRPAGRPGDRARAQPGPQGAVRVDRERDRAGVADRDPALRRRRGASAAGRWSSPTGPCSRRRRPTHLAKAYAAHIGAGYLEAEGMCKGNPSIKAGSKVKIDGIGTKFGGTYVDLVVRPPLPGLARLPDALLDHRPLRAQPRRPDDAEGQARLGQLGRDRRRHEQQRPRQPRPRARLLPGARRAAPRAGGRGSPPPSAGHARAAC